MSRSGRRGGGLILGGAALLALSLLLTWSHQLSPSFLARYGGADALRGVPRDPDAWQVYSTVDVLLILLAAALAVAAVAPAARAARAWLLAGVAVAVAFTIHAVAVPPTNGVTIFDPGRHAYAANAAAAGLGETVALLGLGLAAAGLVRSLSRGR